MPLRLFVSGAPAAIGYTVSPAPSFYNPLREISAALGSSGTSIVLAAGASRISYTVNTSFATGIPRFTGTVTGSWRICRQFQTVVPTNVYTKVRVHRATLSGTEYTIVASSEWSGEVRTDKISQSFEMHLDQVDLGTWSITHALIIEYNYRNAGASSITPQVVGGLLHQNAIYTPLSSSAGYGYTARRSAGQRPYIYSRGGINGTVRQGATTGTLTSSGTVTGTQGGEDFSGTVTGSSTTTGSATGRAGYAGTTTGICTSTGTATGTASQSQGGGSVSLETYVRPRHVQMVQRAHGHVRGTTYSVGIASGAVRIHMIGAVSSKIMSVAIVSGAQGATGTLRDETYITGKITGTARHSLDDESLLLLMHML